MAKRKAKSGLNGTGPKKSQPIRDYVELVNGAKLYLLPIGEDRLNLSDYLAEKVFSESDDYIPTPTYDAGGETILWDAESMDQDGTDEEKKAWVEYEESQKLFEAEKFRQRMKLALVEGTRLFVSKTGVRVELVIDDFDPEFSPPDNWAKRQTGMGIDLPDDPYDLKHLFLSAFIADLKTQQEILFRCTSLALQGYATEEDILAHQEAIFRRQVAATKGKFRSLVTAVDGEGPGSAGMDLQLPDDGVEDGPELEPDAGPMGSTEQE